MIPEDLTIAAATALVTALLSAGTTYLALVSKIRRELEAQYDKDLRERRMSAYTALWALTEPLARYSPPEALTPDGARWLSKRLRGWYFRQGIVLSAAARDAYFDLQKRLTEGPAAAAPARTNPLGGDDLKGLRDASRRMHTALCGDVASRRPPMIGSHDRKRWSLEALWRSVVSAARGPAAAAQAEAADSSGAAAGVPSLRQ